MKGSTSKVLIFISVIYFTYSSQTQNYNGLEDICAKNEAFWDIFSTFISKIYLSALSISILDSQDHIIHEHIGILLREVFQRVEKPITIMKYNLENNHDTQLAIRRTTDVYLFFVRGKEEFRHLFENNFLSNKRKFNFIFYLSNLEKVCSDLLHEIKTTLIRSWIHNRTRNVLINTPCYCFQDEFYSYDSFFFDNGRGKVMKIPIYTFEQERMYLFPALQNFKGYPIRTSVFPRVPTSIKYTRSPWYVKENLSITSNYGGFDGLVLVNMAHYLNFTPLTTETSNGYGWKEDNGTYVGSLGEVIYGRVDISANSRFFEHFESDRISNTDFITNVYLCFIVPKSDKIPQWMEIFTCFSYNTWTLIFLTMFLLSIAWFLIQRTESNLYKHIQQKKPNLCLSLYSIVFLVHNNFPSSLSGRILLSGGLCLHIILTAIFQGNLATSFSIVSFYPDINTLDELLKSDLLISTNLDILNNATSPILKALHEKKAHQIYNSSLDRAAYYKDVCAVERKIDAELLIKTEYVDHDGFPLLHINECPVYKSLVYIVPKESPFLSAFNSVLRRFREAGLTDKWYKDFINIHLVENHYKKKKNSTNSDLTYMPVAFNDIEAAFYFFIIGTIVSFIAFLGEILIYHNFRRVMEY